jgi:hypothetical protein
MILKIKIKSKILVIHPISNSNFSATSECPSMCKNACSNFINFNYISSNFFIFLPLYSIYLCVDDLYYLSIFKIDLLFVYYSSF